MIKMAFHFVASMARHQWAKWRGYEILAPVPIMVVRARKCGGCIFNEDEQCSRCKCLIASKVMMSLESCPEGFWGPSWRKKKSPYTPKKETIS